MPNNFIKGIIGDGFLTEVILTAFMRRLDISPEDTYVLAKTSGRCQELWEQYNVHAVQNSMVFVPPAKMIVLAVELEDAPRIMKQIADKVSDEAVIISVIQGLKLGQIESYFPDHVVIRMIMNPWIVNGYGVSTYVVGSHNSEEAANIARDILISLGETIEVDSEDELETVGELILSETLFSYITVKALINNSEAAGLSSDKSKEIVRKILTSSSRAISNTDAVTDSVLERSYNKGTFLERSRQLLEKYGIMETFQKSFEDALAEKNIFKFHYR